MSKWMLILSIMIALLGTAAAFITRVPCRDLCPVIFCQIGTVCRFDKKTCRSRCVPKCIDNCQDIYKPVCGSDGRTYSNQCELDLASCRSNGKIKKVSDGECTKCIDNCQDIYKPVCGSDGRTYSNQCELDLASCRSNGKIKKVSDGECKSLSLCPPPLQGDLVCGQAITIFCTEDCRQCCIAPNTCQPGGIIPYTKTKDQCR